MLHIDDRLPDQTCDRRTDDSAPFLANQRLAAICSIVLFSKAVGDGIERQSLAIYPR